jgi:hypothetical protein
MSRLANQAGARKPWPTIVRAVDDFDQSLGQASPIYPDQILVCGAKEHDLKSSDVKLPRSELEVITGVCGSGKLSLSLDTLYAEGQRRHVKSLSSYVLQCVG